jgi:hypothetical protein
MWVRGLAEGDCELSLEGLPEPVEMILHWWSPRMHEILGSNVRSVMLFGGLALGDFAPAWSDVDVCVVLDVPVDEGQGKRICRLHDQMLDRFVHQPHDCWRSLQVIEAWYVPAELAANRKRSLSCYVAAGTTRKFAGGDPLGPFDWYTLAHHGKCYSGRPIRFSPPDRSELRAALREPLTSLVSPSEQQLKSSIWLAGMMQWIARSIVFWRDGVMMSKTAALEHEIVAGSPFAEQFKLALRFRREGSAATRSHLDEIRESFLAIAKPAAELMKQLVDE